MGIVKYARIGVAAGVYYLLLLPYVPIGLIGMIDDWLDGNEQFNNYVCWAKKVTRKIGGVK